MATQVQSSEPTHGGGQKQLLPNDPHFHAQAMTQACTCTHTPLYTHTPVHTHTHPPTPPTLMQKLEAKLKFKICHYPFR